MQSFAVNNVSTEKKNSKKNKINCELQSSSGIKVFNLTVSREQAMKSTIFLHLGFQSTALFGLFPHGAMELTGKYLAQLTGPNACSNPWNILK